MYLIVVEGPRYHGTLVPCQTVGIFRYFAKYPKYLKIPETKRDTRKYPIASLLPDPNPTRYPVFCPIPDPTRPDIEKPYPLGIDEK